MLGDGPVAVAVVVRWLVCVGRQGAMEAGTEEAGEWAEPSGILLSYYAVWSGIISRHPFVPQKDKVKFTVQFPPLNTAERPRLTGGVGKTP